METLETQPRFRKDGKVNWYRCRIDKDLLAELKRTSDWRGYSQALGHLGMWFATGCLSYLAFRNVTAATAYWSVPLLLAALFAHGTVGAFMGGSPCHELSHKTPFKNKKANEFFFKVFAFFGWFDRVGYRPSHIRHHQLTVYHDYDGEVVLPLHMSFKGWRFWLGMLAWNPMTTWYTLKTFYRRATGRVEGEWMEFLFPENNELARRKFRNWHAFVLVGHAVLATVFIATGHWFLVMLFSIGSHCCHWLTFLTGVPQHIGLKPDVPDHRLCCRTFTCGWLPGFLYWNMQYHADHHMFPAVPFFNLPKLHAAIRHDMPPVPHGLRATWKEIRAIVKRQQEEPGYYYVPPLPGESEGTRAGDEVLEREAALTGA